MENGNRGVEKRRAKELQEIYKQNRLVESQDEWLDGVKAAMSCIHEYLYGQRLTVAWMKEQCGLNGKNFSGKFKHYVGKSPRQYWLYHRIETAKLMLKDDILAEVSLMDIALSIGFNNHSTFTKAFKRLEGITPIDFKDRKNSRNNSREVSRDYSKEN